SAADGIRGDEALLDAVAAVATDGHAEPVARAGRGGEVADSVDHGVGGAGGAAETARFDNRRAALLNDADEILLQPFAMADDIRHRAVVDLRVEIIREHRGTVITPDGEVADGGDVD